MVWTMPHPGLSRQGFFACHKVYLLYGGKGGGEGRHDGGGDRADFVAFWGRGYRDVLRGQIPNLRPMIVNHKEVDQMMRGAIDIEDEEGKLRKMPIEEFLKERLQQR